MQLKQGTHLQGGKYRIEKVLGQGGFGITYLAIQTGLDRKIAVKEFFMKELCERNESTSYVTLGTQGSKETVSRFREKFLKEARNIAKLNHPNIVRVIDIFEENGTAYYVMEFAENGSLSDKVKKEGCLSEPLATRYIKQVANALNYIHERKMNHLDIKPSNIMLNENDDAILIDFGLSKQYDETTGKQTSTTPVGISEGYAPMEQYKQGGVGEFSPETDIYALGATFFKLLTGITPPSASDVYEDGIPVNELQQHGVSQHCIGFIQKAMQGRKRDRIKDLNSFWVEQNELSKSHQHINQETTLSFADENTIVAQEQQEARCSQPKVTSNNLQSKGFQRYYLYVALVFIVLCFLAYRYCFADEIYDEINHEYVDLGLPSGTLWATTNLGANSPTEDGDYFECGKTEPGTGVLDTLNLYEIRKGINVDINHDAAYTLWGEDWCLPTSKQFEELLHECEWEWDTNGYTVKGPNGNSIYLPAAGAMFYDGSINKYNYCLDKEESYTDKIGMYWSSSPSEEGFWFNDNEGNPINCLSILFIEKKRSDEILDEEGNEVGCMEIGPTIWWRGNKGYCWSGRSGLELLSEKPLRISIRPVKRQK